MSSGTIDVVALQRAIRLIHCTQKERGATCCTVSLLHSDIVTPRQVSIHEQYNGKMMKSKVSTAMQQASVNADIALQRFYLDLESKNKKGENYRQSLHHVRTRIPSSHDDLGNGDWFERFREIFLAYKYIIAHMIQTQIVAPYSYVLEEGGNRRRINSETVINRRKNTPTKGSEPCHRRARSGSFQSDHKAIPSCTYSFEDEVSTSSRQTEALLSLLISFVRLKESVGIERAFLSSVLAAPSGSNVNETQMPLLFNDLILEIENQRSIAKSLTDKAIELDDDYFANTANLLALIKQCVESNADLEKIYNLIERDFDFEGFRKAITLEKFWSSITIYIDKLHALELLMIEEIEYSIAVTNHSFLTINDYPPNLPKSPSPRSRNSNTGSVSQDDTTSIRAALDTIVQIQSNGTSDGSSLSRSKAQQVIENVPPAELKSYLLSLIHNTDASTSSSSDDESNLISSTISSGFFPLHSKNLSSTSSHLTEVVTDYNVNDALSKPSPSAIVKDWEIDLYDVKFLKRLGRGSAGTTYFGQWRGQDVAIKVAAMTETGLEGWEAEIRSLQRLHHPNIIRMLGCIVRDSPCTHCLVLEYCESGDLTSMLRSNSGTPPNFFWHVTKSIANGMAYLHDRSILHRDIKPDNILLNGNVSSGKFVVKLTDFGLSTSSTGSAREYTAETGTYRYMAPEIIRHQSYSFKADVYSFAMVAWQLITREEPFSSMSQIEAAGLVALETARPPFPQNTPEKIEQIIRSCWSEEPEGRPTFDSVYAELVESEKNGLDNMERFWMKSPHGHSVYCKALSESSSSTVSSSGDKKKTQAKGRKTFLGKFF